MLDLLQYGVVFALVGAAVAYIVRCGVLLSRGSTDATCGGECSGCSKASPTGSSGKVASGALVQLELRPTEQIGH